MHATILHMQSDALMYSHFHQQSSTSANVRSKKKEEHEDTRKHININTKKTSPEEQKTLLDSADWLKLAFLAVGIFEKVVIDRW